MARFLDQHRAPGHQAARVEGVIAVGRALLAVTGLVAIYLDPTEPSRFAEITYGLLAAYALYSMLVLAAMRRSARQIAGFGVVLHAVDIVWASALTFFSEGPFSPFFLFFLFVLLTAAFRGGMRETLATTVVTVVIFLLETSVASIGPWRETWFAGVRFEWTPIIMRTAYLLLTGCLLGYLADHEKQFRAEIAATTHAMQQPRVELGFGGSVEATVRLMLRLFGAAAADIVLQNYEDGETVLWHAAGPDGEPGARRTELDDQTRRIWLFDAPARTWFAAAIDRGDVRALTTEAGEWSPRTVSLDLPGEVVALRPFRSLACVDFGLAGEWRGRLLLYEPRAIEQAASRLHFLASLADHVAPPLSNVFLLERLRSRASAAERARVARELHDGAIQSLIGIEMEAEALRRRAERDAAPLAAELAHIQGLLRTEVIALRELMQELRPVELDAPRRLPDVLAALIERFRRDSGLAAHFSASGDTAALPLRTALEVVRIVQEALVNVRKHSRARNVLVHLSERQGAWTVTIEDDGRGFEFAGRLAGDALEHSWVGPAMIRERTRDIGGRLVLESTPGAGARVEVHFNANAVAHS